MLCRVRMWQKKYEAWGGWKVISINGNNVEEIRGALKEAKAEKERPTLIIGNTIMGFGAVKADNSSFESQVSTHGQPLSAAGGGDVALTIKKSWVVTRKIRSLFYLKPKNFMKNANRNLKR